MPIACTRCGAKEDGEILTAPIAFTFKHERGCGHGVGPLIVIRGKFKESKLIPKEPETTKEKVKEKSIEKIVVDEANKKSGFSEIKLKSEPKAEKTKAESQKD